MKICLSKVYKAEKIELSDDRLSAGSSKGYRMVRATRGVVEGAWYFEIRVLKLGETGHTRLGWSTEKGDLQAPVGYDGNSFGYRDVDRSKVHKALRENMGRKGMSKPMLSVVILICPREIYIHRNQYNCFGVRGRSIRLHWRRRKNLPKLYQEVSYVSSEMEYFKVWLSKICAGGRYYPVASMYTFPNQPNCVVKFNFGPNFEFPPQYFEHRPIPSPRIEVPYQGFGGRVKNGGSVEKKQ